MNFVMKLDEAKPNLSGIKIQGDIIPFPLFRAAIFVSSFKQKIITKFSPIYPDITRKFCNNFYLKI